VEKDLCGIYGSDVKQTFLVNASDCYPSAVWR
jgi:hypothetical protein